MVSRQLSVNSGVSESRGAYHIERMDWGSAQQALLLSVLNQLVHGKPDMTSHYEKDAGVSSIRMAYQCAKIHPIIHHAKES